MQKGSLIQSSRRRGPDVWEYRWRESCPGDKRKHRRIVIGSLDTLRDKAAALKATAALRREINRNDARLRAKPLTVAELINHYRQRELATENEWKTLSTRTTYEGYLRKWIEPRWGPSSLNTVRAVEVEMWLGTLPLARGSRAKIRNLMSAMFNHGRRPGFIDRNPISLVRQSAKRQTVPDVLHPSEINRLLQGLHNRERTLVLLAAGTGLRMCELFGLKWRDIDFAGKQASVLRSIVKQAVGPCKTEASQKPVPLDPRMVRTLRAWRRCARFRQPTDWVFASPATQGSLPFLGTDFDAALHPADGNKVGHHQTNRLAHFPSFVFNVAKGKWRGHKGYARATSPCIHPCDIGHVYTGGNTGKASCANGSRCTVLHRGKE
jgi:integrase